MSKQYDGSAEPGTHIRQLKQTLAAFYQARRLMTSEVSQQQLIREMCRIFTDIRGYPQAWIVLLDRERQIAASAESGMGRGFSKFITKLKRGWQGPCLLALSNSSRVYQMGRDKGCHECPLQAAHADHLLRQGIRLEHQGQFFGWCGVAMPQQLFSEQEENELFEGLTRDLAFALHHIEQEDIRRQTQNILRESEQKYRVITDNSIDIIWQMDLRLRFTYVSPSILPMFGFTVEEWVGSRLSEHATTKEFFNMARKVLHAIKYYRDIQHVTFEAVMKRKDGSDIPIEINGKIISNQAGLPIGMQGTTRDISERRNAERALRERDRHMTSLLENPTGYLIYRLRAGSSPLDVEVIHVSPSILSVLGIKEDQKHQFQAWFQHIHPDDLDRMLKANERGTRPPFVFDESFRYIHPQKGLRWLHVQARGLPFNDRPERIEYSNGIVIDITEQKRAEDTLHDTLISLEQRIQERTGELVAMNQALQQEIAERTRTEQALQQAKEAAETTNKAKSVFLANMSHELRTPLNAILGYAQILQEADNLEPHQRKAMTTIKESGDHLLRMIIEILDLAKIEAGRLELLPENINLAQFLRSIRDMIRVHAEQKHLTFSYECDPYLPEGVHADGTRLREILINLLGNAVKFTQQGSVTLRVRSKQQAASSKQKERVDGEIEIADCRLPTARLSFEVEDTGPGIAQEYLTEIFQPFRQLEGKQFSEGTGLGLAISAKWIEMMGGSLEVASSPGMGSRFWFELDLPEVELSESVYTPGARKITGYSGTRRKILVIDDKHANRAVLVSMLLPLDFEVIEADSGIEGLQKGMTVRPDIVLLDLKMPGMDGFEVARRIRQIDTLRSIPVIAVSANAFEETRQKSLDAGCTDFFAKPFELSDLLDLLQKYLCLEWVSDDTRIKPEKRVELTTPLSEYIVPPAIEHALLQRATRGDIRGILEQLDKLERSGGELFPLVSHLRTLAETFQIDTIVEILEDMGQQMSDDNPR